MASITLVGDTSGTVTLTVPAVAGTNTVTVPAGTGTVAVQGVSTNIVSGTAVASTSGTAIDFTSIPSWVKRITVMFNGVSTSGTSPTQIQLGAGSVDATSYVANVMSTQAAVSTSGGTTGFYLTVSVNVSAATAVQGSFVLTLLGSNTWTGVGSLARDTGNNTMFFSAGSKTLSGTLDRVRITTVNGTDTFDAGSINILWE